MVVGFWPSVTVVMLAGTVMVEGFSVVVLGTGSTSVVEGEADVVAGSDEVGTAEVVGATIGDDDSTLGVCAGVA